MQMVKTLNRYESIKCLRGSWDCDMAARATAYGIVGRPAQSVCIVDVRFSPDHQIPALKNLGGNPLHDEKHVYNRCHRTLISLNASPDHHPSEQYPGYTRQTHECNTSTSAHPTEFRPHSSEAYRCRNRRSRRNKALCLAT